jgi:ABC-2 type transport system permease protein
VSIIIFFIAPFAFKATLPSNLTVYFLSLIVFIIACLMIGTVLGLLVKSISKLTMLSQVVFLPSILLSGIMFPVSMLPKALGYVGKIFPASHAMEIMTSTTPKLVAFIPLIVIIALTLGINLYKLSRMKME